MAVHSNGKNLMIFSCNSNKEMAEDIAKEVGVPLGKSHVSTFADGETSVSIGETVRGSDVFIVQSTCKPVNDNLMELLIMTDAMVRASANSITAVIPYFGYARQDRKTRARDPISAKLVADLITVAGVDRVLSMDLHTSQLQGFFNIPLDHLVGVPIILDYFKDFFSEEDKKDVTIISPDLGSVARSRTFAERFDVPLAIIDKRRQKANESEVVNIIGDVEGRIVVLVDDIIDTAGTLCNAAEALVKIGGAKKVYAAATHPVLSHPAIERIEASPIESVIVMDTIPLSEEAKQCKKLKVIKSAQLFGRAIRHIYEDRAVSPLFV